MAIPVGQRLGPYEILSAIGAGGMGEVYRARDARLNRDVALKILPEAFSRDPQRKARFEREAQILASLNHPNIAAIYGLEESDSTLALFMELVEGPTLADRIRNGPIPLDETLPIAKQIASALEYAHDKNIIHRDLKPANIKVTADGAVKVLDFGLAKAMSDDSAESDLSNSPTLSMAATRQGVILGTAAYMSPEQAKGKQVDRRTDVWAFGCVLYAMLTGKEAFQGEDITEILAAVMKTEPDWQALPAATPIQIRTLLKRCLQKDKALRMQAAGDARIEIQETLTARAEPQAVVASKLGGWRLPLSLALFALIVAALGGLAVWNLKPTPAKAVSRTVITLPPGDQLASLDFPAIAISPDGMQLAYVAIHAGTRQIFLRALDSLEAKPVPGTDEANTPFFSPDGHWLGFFVGGTLKKISVGGGAPVTLAHGAVPSGATWSSDGEIVFAPTNLSVIEQISDGGGAPRPLTHLDKGEARHLWPELLPGSKAALFATTGANPGIVVQTLSSGEWHDLISGGTAPHYATTGHLIYAQGENLMAAPFDPKRLQITGAAIPLVEGVLQYGFLGGTQYALSRTGSLVYVPSGTVPAKRLVWVSRDGTEQVLAALPHGYTYPRISPDGRRAVVTITEQEGQLWLYDLSRGTLTRLTFGPNLYINPAWTPDGKRIAFMSNREGPLNIFWQLADGSGGLERLTTGEYTQAPGSFSPDGQELAFIEVNPTTGLDIWVLRMGDHRVQPFLRTPFDESAPTFSPDGHWLAYISDESGRWEVYVQPYPGPGGKYQISTEGGTEPAWNPNGRELFYRNRDKMMSVDISTQPIFSASKPRMLFQGPYAATPLTFPYYDVSPDGQRFLMIKPGQETSSAATQIVIVQNWFEELKRRVPTGK